MIADQRKALILFALSRTNAEAIVLVFLIPEGT